MARLTRGSDFSVGLSKQTVQGTINTSPVFTPYTRSSGKPAKKIGYTQDDTVTTDYNAVQNIQDSVELTAEIESSAAKQSISLMIAAIHGAQVTYTNTASTFASLADGFTVPVATYAALLVGDGFWVTGFAGATINGFFIVASKGASNKIVTTIAPAATESAGASVTLKSNRAVNADTTSYYTLQRRTADTSAAGSVSYFTTYDQVLDTFDLTIGETGIIKGKAGFKGEQEVSGVALVSGQTYASAPTDQVLSAVQNVEDFYVDGVSATCLVKSMGINIANAYSGDDAAGCQKYYARGAFTVGGDLSIRSRIDNTLNWEAIYRAGTRKAIAVRLSHSTTEETYIVLTRVVMTDHSQEDTNSAVASHKMTQAAEGDATTGYTIGIFTNW